MMLFKMMVGAMMCCALMPLIIASVFCGIYWSLWAEANWANDNSSEAESLLFNDEYPYYDTCGLGTLAQGDD